ncbi:MAG: acyl-CoA dehydrogenase family protein [Chloroflexi bacterium]|nr:acyl-CoA dehydrogenase family protein [Chloroflexota bacterium]
MIFELNEQQRLLQKNIHEFARKELAPKSSYWDAGEEFPWESVRKMAGIGLTGLRLPRQYGGTDADLMSAGLALEEVARFDLSCAIILCSANITGRVLLHAANPIKDEWLPGIVKGEKIVAFAAAEPEAGSDVRAVRTVARRQGDVLVVDGEKSMITSAVVAAGIIALVKTDPTGEGISIVFVEAGRPGITIHPLPGFGWRATRWGNISFDGVKVPVGNLIGEEGNALNMLKGTVQEQRALTGLVALGAAQQAVEEAVDYARIRRVFGKPLAKFEGIQFKLAEDFASIEASRLVCYKALYLIEKKARDASMWAAMANLMGGETAYKAVNDAMDVFGGSGYSRELRMERYLRDIKGVQLASATLKIEIGRGLFGEEFVPYA